MSTIHEQLQSFAQDATGAYEANFFPREIAINQQALRNVLAAWDELRLIQAEGAVEVTIRSRTTSITLGLDQTLGSTLVQDLHETLGRDAHRLAGLITRLHEQLVTEGESTERIALLKLLLTPVSATGHALAIDSQQPPVPFRPASTSPRRTVA